MAKSASKKRYWFKAKKYGWGWVPATWEGWLVVIGFIIFIADYALRVEKISSSASDTVYALALPILVGIATLLMICYFMGEPPHWQWGGKKRKIK